MHSNRNAASTHRNDGGEHQDLLGLGRGGDKKRLLGCRDTGPPRSRGVGGPTAMGNLDDLHRNLFPGNMFTLDCTTVPLRTREQRVLEAYLRGGHHLQRG